MESVDFHTARALLEWQIELGADECIGDTPVDRYVLPEKLAKPKQPDPKPHLTKGPVVLEARDPVKEAQAVAQSADTLEELRAALEGFELCDLKRGARNLIFSEGVAGAPVMIVGDAPDRDEDRVGKLFIGAAGQMLDRMFAAIGMGRARKDAPVYITGIMPWCPRTSDPRPNDMAMMTPFLLRHIELAKPKALVIMGNGPCQALLARRGISRLRGNWTQVVGVPALPMLHPAALLRNPEMKRDAWADLLSLKAAVDK